MKIRCESDYSFEATEAPAAALTRWEPGLRLMAAASDDETSISMFDVIGEGFLTEGVTARRVDAALRRIGRGRSVTVNINSPGGDMFEGIAIYNLLREHRGSVRVNVLGMAASAASIIAMAGDDIVMNRGSMLMIHNPWTIAMGDFRDFERAAADLKKFADRLAEIYRARTDQPDKTIRDMLDAETWLSDEDAKRLGFATKIEELKTKQDADAAASRSKARGLETVNAALRREGLTRTERRQILQELGVAAPVTGDDPGTAPVTGSKHSDACLASLLHDLKRTME